VVGTTLLRREGADMEVNQGQADGRFTRPARAHLHVTALVFVREAALS
jgi:hypothetical protein